MNTQRIAALTGIGSGRGAGYGYARLHSVGELPEVGPETIVVVADTSPALMPRLFGCAGVIAEQGGTTSHAAIACREAGIPCIVGATEALARLHDGQELTVDCAEGTAWRGEDRPALDRWRDETARNAADELLQTPIPVLAMVSTPEVAGEVGKRPFAGIGMARAEMAMSYLGIHPQHALATGQGPHYSIRLAASICTFCQAFAGRPVLWRLSDFKTNEYRALAGGEEYEPLEANPMLGFRGALRYLTHPEAFALEVEALRLARLQHDNLHVMVPFVRTPAELKTVIELLRIGGVEAGPTLRLWMMAELPANVFNLPAFLEVGIHGVSIGSNDLTQLTMGVDRDNPTLAAAFNERDPAVRAAMRAIIRQARAHGAEASICGQVTSNDPAFARELLDWGITSVTVAPDALGPTKRALAVGS